MGDTACFFVDDKNVADKLKSKSHRITCQDGSKVRKDTSYDMR